MQRHKTQISVHCKRSVPYLTSDHILVKIQKIKMFKILWFLPEKAYEIMLQTLFLWIFAKYRHLRIAFMNLRWSWKEPSLYFKNCVVYFLIRFEWKISIGWKAKDGWNLNIFQKIMNLLFETANVWFRWCFVVNKLYIWSLEAKTKTKY